YFKETWSLLLPENAYARSVEDDRPRTTKYKDLGTRFPHPIVGGAKEASKAYYDAMMWTPFGDLLTFDFIKAAIEGEDLGNNPAGVTYFLATRLLERLLTKPAWRTAPLASRAIGVALVGGLLLLFADESPEAAPSHHHFDDKRKQRRNGEKDCAPKKNEQHGPDNRLAQRTDKQYERSSAGCHARDGGQYDRYIKDQRSPPQILQ